MLSLGVDRRINQKPEYNQKARIQSENQNTIGKPEYNQKIRIQSKSQNTIRNPEYNRKNRTTYKKIKTGETQKHQNTKEKGECSGYTISAAKNNIWRR